MRRKEGTLLPLELSILESGLELRASQTPEFYGFLIAKELAERDNARKLTGYGTLYKALSRLESQGFLASRWEDPLIAAEENRPRRRLYKVTVDGAQALLNAQAPTPQVIKKQAAEGLAHS